ncbi:TetR/AcrR family transcriptional regulator [Lysinibacillus sp. KU-BSD001]|uniref:TetR/AcrR family transcriptional regulator n=1 Tax=Lysinibacillus sp. KU-BSD001 TaxID=3141328 RepID=UPI0036EECC16
MNKRKKLVVDHALSLFVEKGIGQTSIQDILERASISKGTFYNYFSSKHECVGAILEQARYDATLARGEIMIGKDPQDVDVLIEQITVLSSINRSRGIDRVFEEILHSGDMELKKLVLKYRVLELDWLATRFVEVFGDDIRDYAFEAAVLYYGMMQHLSFTGKLIHQNTLEVKAVATSTMKYMKEIVPMLIHQGTGLFDIQNVSVFIGSFTKVEVSAEEVLEQLETFQAQPHFTKPQQDVTDALLEEIKKETPREIVVHALLRAFTYEFKDSPYTNEVKELSSVVWYLVKQLKM